MRPKKVLGVLGGMGPAATADFLRLLAEKAPASCDQEHPQMIVPLLPTEQRIYWVKDLIPGPIFAGESRACMNGAPRCWPLPAIPPIFFWTK